jgi:ABC-type Fe3+ transport system permease subunit
LIKAGVLSGAILAFTRSLGETGATMMAAGALQTVPILIVFYKNSTPADMDSAIFLSIIFLLISAFLFLLMRVFLRKNRISLGKVNVGLEKRLCGMSPAGDAAGALFFIAIVLLPSFFFLKFTDFNFFNSSVLGSILVSFGIAGGATILSILFGLPLSMFIASKKKGSSAIRLLNDLALLMPTVLIGLSVSLFWSGRLDESLILVFAHVAIIFPYFVSSLSEILSEMDKSLVEVARSLGATPFKAFRTITLPLIMPTFIAGLLVAFMRSIAETGGTLAVSKNIVTIPVLIVNLSKAGQDAQAASAALLLLAFSLLVVFMLRRNQAKKKWGSGKNGN